MLVRRNIRAYLAHQLHLATNFGYGLACYRMPNQNGIYMICGAVKKTLTEKESGFAFFNFAGKPMFIQNGFEVGGRTFAGNGNFKFPYVGFDTNVQSTKQQDFFLYVEKALHTIASGDLQKVVTARVSAITRDPKLDPTKIFLKACERYPNAFCSLVFAPKHGLWIGATPEILVAKKSKKFIIHALAGTHIATDNTPFSEKEKDEQEIVSRFIEKKLRALKVNFTHSKVSEVGAGNLTHLRSKFSIIASKNISLLKLARILHPTPAVAGLPRKGALQFIQHNEHIPRYFYSGYLGPVRLQHDALFVNLRCCGISNQQVLFYAGCGITAQSNAKKEWQETSSKLAVMQTLFKDK